MESILTLLKNDYNVNIEEITLKKYTIIKYNVIGEQVNLSKNLPILKRSRIFYISFYIKDYIKRCINSMDRLWKKKMKRKN